MWTSLEDVPYRETVLVAWGEEGRLLLSSFSRRRLMTGNPEARLVESAEQRSRRGASSNRWWCKNLEVVLLVFLPVQI
ncbi:unnamed protein product [Amoebophrya sp. A25]|nr:unnamed protein product [Amoebophrya sp. A25]|eukprot:GSA25T00019477001.1